MLYDVCMLTLVFIITKCTLLLGHGAGNAASPRAVKSLITEHGVLQYAGQDHVIPNIYLPLVAQHWPGPLTILLPASPLIPANVTAGHSTVAVRMPSHPVARALIHTAGRTHACGARCWVIYSIRSTFEWCGVALEHNRKGAQLPQAVVSVMVDATTLSYVPSAC